MSNTFREANGFVYFDEEPISLEFFNEFMKDYVSVGKDNYRFFSQERRYVIIDGNQMADNFPINKILNYLKRAPYIIADYKAKLEAIKAMELEIARKAAAIAEAEVRI